MAIISPRGRSKITYSTPAIVSASIVFDLKRPFWYPIVSQAGAGSQVKSARHIEVIRGKSYVWCHYNLLYVNQTLYRSGTKLQGIEVGCANAISTLTCPNDERNRADESAIDITSLVIITTATNILRLGLSCNLDLYTLASLRGLTDS